MSAVFASLLSVLALWSWDAADHEWHGFYDHGCGLCHLEGNDCGECEQDEFCGGLCLADR